jgi:hypothetical protein
MSRTSSPFLTPPEIRSAPPGFGREIVALSEIQFRDFSIFLERGSSVTRRLYGLGTGHRARMQMFCYQTLGAGGNGRIFTKSWKPLNERLLAEPG